MITIREVAQDCGLSMATVSNVLSDSSRPVHPRTRERVLESARRLKYHPNAMARSLTGRPVETIGVLFGVVEPEVIPEPETKFPMTWLVGSVKASLAAVVLAEVMALPM